MVYRVKCRCGKSEKAFKNNLNMEFFIGECCEAAGYDFKGDLKKDSEKVVVKKDSEKVVGKEVKMTKEYEALMKEVLGLYPHISKFDPKNMPTSAELKKAIKVVREEQYEALKEQRKLDEATVLKPEEIKIAQAAELQKRLVKADRSLFKAKNKTSKAKWKAEVEKIQKQIKKLNVKN